MIRYYLIPFILACGYYTFTYGKSLWVDDRNKLAGFGTVFLALLGTAAPIIFMFMKE